MYRFYKKPMAFHFTIIRKSSIAENLKVAIASAEIQRRLKRTSTMIGKHDQERIILEFVDNLLRMGYPTV